MSEESSMTTRPCCGQFSVGSGFVEGLHKLDHVLFFVRGCLQSHLVQVSSILNDVSELLFVHVIVFCTSFVKL